MNETKVPMESKILQVARYLETGQISQRQIAAACHVSKNLVSTVSQKMHAMNWKAADVEAMGKEERINNFRRADQPKEEGRKQKDYEEPDYEYYCQELLKPGVTKALLHEEYVEHCTLAGTVPLQLTQFKEHLGEHLRKKAFSEIIQHKPADETEVDWTGDPAKWTDPDTGEVQYGWLFVGVLPFSGYGYAEVFPDMTLPNWIAAHVHMFNYFGGFTRVLVCDNLKTGVIKHPATGDVILQSDYEAFGNYYGMAICPARVRKPDDKGTVEGTVKIFETHILAKLRNFQCFSMREYNEEVLKQLKIINDKPFQKKEGSRTSTFEKYEKAELIPLPSVPYEYFIKKKAKVYKNCCIAYGKNYYSVPYQFIGERVTLRVYNDRLEVYAGDTKLCEHPLIRGHIGRYAIDNSHLPPNSSRYGDWNSTCLKRWAETYGPYTYEVVDRIFRNGGAEQKFYNGVISLLKLADSYTPARVEKACQLALNHYKRPTYRNIKAILNSRQDMVEIINSAVNKSSPVENEENACIRGAAYYAKKK